MKDKKLVVAAVIVLAAVIIGVMFMAKPSKVKAPAKTARAQKASQALKPSPVKSAPVKPAPAKKVFSKGMGGLTVRILGTGNREAGLRCRAFKAIDPSTSLLVASFNTNRMQEFHGIRGRFVRGVQGLDLYGAGRAAKIFYRLLAFRHRYVLI